MGCEMSETGIQKFQSEASLPSEAEFENLTRQAKIFISSGFLPSNIKTPEQAITIAIKGRELGIPPMQAFSHINIISGKPAMSAELMLALVFRGCPTAVVEFTQNDNKACVINARRRVSDKVSVFRFDLDDAKAAQLLEKDSWKKYPAAMLRARCVSAMGRGLFPDCLMGVSYTAEELGAEVTIDGTAARLPEEAKPAQVVAEVPKEAPKNEEIKRYKWQDELDNDAFEPEAGWMEWFKATAAFADTSDEILEVQKAAKEDLDESAYKMIEPHLRGLWTAKRKAEKPKEAVKA